MVIKRTLTGAPDNSLEILVNQNTHKHSACGCYPNDSVDCKGVSCTKCPLYDITVTLGAVREEWERRRQAKVTESHKGGGAGIYVIGKPEPMSVSDDMVNRPSHYTSGGIECLDAIQSSMTEEAFNGFLKGNVMKYIWRYEKKINPLEDLRKARWYLNKLEAILEKAKQTHGEAVPKG